MSSSCNHLFFSAITTYRIFYLNHRKVICSATIVLILTLIQFSHTTLIPVRVTVSKRDEDFLGYLDQFSALIVASIMYSIFKLFVTIFWFCAICFPPAELITKLSQVSSKVGYNSQDDKNNLSQVSLEV